MSYTDDDALPRAAVAVVAGYGAVIAAAFIAAGLLPVHDLAARALTVAVVATVAAALIEDWRAAAGVTVFAALVFVGFLAHRYGVLTGDASAWSYTPVVVAGAVLGRGRRWWHAWRRVADPQPPTGRRVIDGVIVPGSLIDDAALSLRVADGNPSPAR
ncbi:hypothetical protein ACQP2F_32585 [Actinoplanes sp. CA-030573]|uniref:hypothetical protein n=1 Tax=Actinoplanes sp. CA-030573 TaxID=3239898 RepID=UPI003D92B068